MSDGHKGAMTEMLPVLSQWWPGNLSYRDFVADLAGIALAAAGILLYHQAVGTAASSSLSSLAHSLRPTAAGARQQAYKPVPTDIEMGTVAAE